MKKTILAALFVFVLIFGTNVYGGQVILPDQNAKLSETVNIEPIAEPLVIKPFEYQIRRGDNLTKLARTFGTNVDELRVFNEGNPSVKSKDLILAGGKLRVPLYSAELVWKLADFYREEVRITASAEYERGQGSKLPNIYGLIIISLVLVLLLCWWFVWGIDLKQRLWETKDKLKALETEFQHVHMKLGLAHEQLKLKEGADEEIKNQKKENDRLVETVSHLYADKDMISVNLAETHAKLEAAEKQLKLMPCQLVSLDSQEHGKIWVKILKLEASKEGELDIFVECPKNGCLVNVAKNLKAQNALSHMASAYHWPTNS